MDLLNHIENERASKTALLQHYPRSFATDKLAKQHHFIPNGLGPYTPPFDPHADRHPYASLICIQLPRWNPPTHPYVYIYDTYQNASNYQSEIHIPIPKPWANLFSNSKTTPSCFIACKHMAHSSTCECSRDALVANSKTTPSFIIVCKHMAHSSTCESWRDA